MSSPRPGASRQTTTKKRKDVNMETIGRNAVNVSSLMYLEDWDLMDNNKGLAKLQHKLNRQCKEQVQR